MTSSRDSALASARLRASAGYELVLLDRLGDAERALVERQAGDAELYGVLRPRPGSGLEARAADADTALLFMTLAAPAALPRYVRARLGADAERTVGRLVLDGVLELEHEGAFVGGADAGPLLLSARSTGGRGRIGELSEAALRYGQELAALPHALLARRLYAYGTRPLRRELADADAVARACGLAPGGPAHAPLAAGWVEQSPSDGARAHWRQWRPRAAPDDGSAWKLYVSPALDALPEAVAAVAATLAGAPGVSAFKLGRDAAVVCRPDKLVVYFERLDDLHAGAAALRTRLDGLPAQGVPFTAAVTDDGLLSWGADPPAAAERRTSWRMWVAERLAEHLAAAAERRDGLPPWRFALERLRLAGVDVDSWIPASGMWPEALASG